jgi:transcriptional regulator with XRE-family HTH domain
MSERTGGAQSGFGKRLCQLREDEGMSQGELAKRAGVNLMTVSRIERGVNEPTWPVVLALAEALGVSCEAFRDVAPQDATTEMKPGRPRKAEAPPAAAEMQGKQKSNRKRKGE